MKILTIKEQADYIFCKLHSKLDTDAEETLRDYLGSICLEDIATVIARACIMLRKTMRAIDKGKTYSIVDSLECIYALLLMIAHKYSVERVLAHCVLDLINCLLKLRNAQNDDEIVKIYDKAWKNATNFISGTRKEKDICILLLRECYIEIVNPLFESGLAECCDKVREVCNKWL